jgi:hypothetical protein
MRKLICLSSFVLALSACVTVPNTTVCTVSGVMADGAICAETLTDKTSELTLTEWIDFLEPQPERPDPVHPGETLPARAGAMCQSSEDWNKMKTALEQACRELGNRCSYQIKTAIRSLKQKLKQEPNGTSLHVR